MKALLTGLLILAMVWPAPAQQTPRPTGPQPHYTLVELFGAMVVIGGLAYLNLWLRWKNAHSPTDSRDIWPPETNAPTASVHSLSSPLAVGTLEAGDNAVVIHPDITSQGLVDGHGPTPTLYTSAFETVLQQADGLSGFGPLYTVRGFVSANGVWTFLLKGTNYVAQSYALLDPATLCATNTFPSANIGTGNEASKFYRLAAP